MPPMNPNLGAPKMTQKHLAISEEEMQRVKDLYKSMIGVSPAASMDIEEVEKALEDVNSEKMRLFNLAREEDRRELASTYVR